MPGDVLDVIERWTQPGHSFQQELWIYPADAPPGATVQVRSRTTEDGRLYQDDAIQFREPSIDDGPTTGFTPDATGEQVDYDSRTWEPAQEAALMVDDLAPNPIGSTAFDPAPNSGSLLRQQVAAGKWRRVGITTIDGLRTIELSETDGEVRYLYVVPPSYLIVREVVGGTGPPYVNGVGRPTSTTTDFTYLPPDHADLALLDAPIPSGFLESGVQVGPTLTVAQVQAGTGLPLSPLVSLPSSYPHATCPASMWSLGPKVSMPSPEILNATISLPGFGQTLSPPTSTPRYSASDAWAATSMLVDGRMWTNVGPIWLVLADLTDQDGQSTDRLVWVRVAENYPPLGGGGGPSLGANLSPATPTTAPGCTGENDFSFYDAQTGQAMFEEN